MRGSVILGLGKQMPPGYTLVRVDDHFIWVEGDRESAIHWGRWAIYRGAWADYKRRAASQGAPRE